MSLYEGAVKKPIMTSLCFLAVAIFGLFLDCEIAGLISTSCLPF